METVLRDIVGRLGGQTALARKLGVTQGVVHQWVRGIRRLPPRRAVEIERLSGGAVRAEDICKGHEFERDEVGAVIGYRVRVQRPEAA